jgi:hypothetical protein
MRRVDGSANNEGTRADKDSTGAAAAATNDAKFTRERGEDCEGGE